MTDPEIDSGQGEGSLPGKVLEQFGKLDSARAPFKAAPVANRPTYRLVRELGRAPQSAFVSPLAVTVGPARQVFILDRPKPDRFRLSAVPPGADAGAAVAEFHRGNADADLLEPAAIAIDGKRRAYVADVQANCVKQFSPDGRWLATFSSAGFDGTRFNGPRDVTVDEAGNLYITDTNNNRVVGLLPDGDLGWVLERFPAGATEDEFYEPYSACVGNGRLWVTDTNQNRVLTFDLPRPSRATEVAGSFVFPTGVRAGPDGKSVYVSDQGNMRVQRFDGGGRVSGAFTVVDRPVGNLAVGGGGWMATDADGHVILIHPLEGTVLVLSYLEP